MPVITDWDISESHLTFQLKGGDRDQFHVIRYRGTEGLCQLYRFELELVSEKTDIDLDLIVGATASFTIKPEIGEKRFHGVVSRIESVDTSWDQGIYRVELMPTVWQLSHRYRSRIFQNKTTVEIVKTVLSDAGIPEDQCKTALSGQYEPREYCVQYRETDYNFICRLLEDEGIWWYFEQGADREVLVLADSTENYPAIQGDPAVPFRPPSEVHPGMEHVFSFRRGHAVRPGAIVLKDYTFENPALDLKSTSESELPETRGLVISDYPGRYRQATRGEKLAKTRVEELQAARVIGVGRSNSPRLMPGSAFELAEHVSEKVNGQYLLTKVTHQGRQSTTFTTTGTDSTASPTNGTTADPRPFVHWSYHGGHVARDVTMASATSGNHPLDSLVRPGLLDGGQGREPIDEETPLYECGFECIPADVPYRPARVTPWPIVRGSQTARVVGPRGEEIHTDEYGRIKVQFNWDLDGEFDDNSSCWIRVSQGMAGGQYGMMFLPRIGQEVVVDFLEGDPDQPIVVGRVFNADHKPPYTLPDEKTKSVIKTHTSKGGKGTNEIRFEDLKGQEQVLIHAQKDMHVRVGEEQRLTIGKSRFLKIGEEDRKATGGHRSTAVGGKDALEVADTRSVVVKKDVYHDFKANHDLKVASEFHVKANKVVVESGTGISFKVGGNFISITPAGIFIKGALIGLNSGGAALPSTIMAQVASPASPAEADEVQPGRDAKYKGEPVDLPPIKEKTVEGHWISIDLKDEEDRPRAGEAFEIVTPSGKVLKGTLDVNGFARRWVDEPGKCRITYPRLDEEEWSRG